MPFPSGRVEEKGLGEQVYIHPRERKRRLNHLRKDGALREPAEAVLVTGLAK